MKLRVRARAGGGRVREQLPLGPDDRARLMESMPGFEALPAEVLRELVARARVELFPAGGMVAREGERGDRCFFVVSGRVEVSVGEGKEATPIGAVGPGGYFGELALVLESGTRQATVTALTDLQVLSVEADAFREALAAHEETRAALDEHVARIMVGRFIEEVGAFASLGAHEREALAARVSPRHVEAGELIVREGETGDSCFMIRSGSVEVVIARDGVESRVDLLTAGALFGEGSLLTGTPRIASVRALEPCELLELRREAVLDASRMSEHITRELSQLIRLREFPRRAEGIELHERTSSTGDAQAVLKNPRLGTYYRLSERGLFVWSRLDGSNNLRRITLDYLTEFNQFAPQFVADLIGGLAAGGFLQASAPPRHALAGGSTLSRWWRTAAGARRLMEWQLSIRGIDRALGAAYRGGIRLLFTRAGLVAMGGLSVFGLAAFVIVGRNATQLLSHAHGNLLLFVYPGLVISIAIHEAGHAFATKAYGRTVTRAGIGWYWFSPIAFVDTSDMWLGTRRQRIVVSLAGPAADLVTAGALSTVALFVSNDTVAAGLWALILPLYLGVLLNLNPLLEFDGYHILTDLLDRPNLRAEALAWVRRSLPSLLRHPGAAKGHWLELAYGIGSLLYIALMAVLTVIFYRLVLRHFAENFLPSEAATAIAWIATITVVLLAASAAIGDLRKLEHSRDRLT